MTPVYHVAAPPPAIAGTDALWQDIDLLARHFQATSACVYPFRTPRPLVPPLLYGWAALNQLRTFDHPGHLHHVFSPVAFAYPYLRKLKQPLVYSVVAGSVRRPTQWLLDRAVWIANNARDRHTLEQAGAPRVHEVRPGINLHRFAAVPPPSQEPFTLLMASAPWTRAQFDGKGVDLLLEALRELQDVRLILLWRGHHTAELHARLSRHGLADRVEVIDRAADVPALLARAHAVILLARWSKLVKAWPHSLIEGLAAGRQVITSEAVAMSDFLREHRAGFVLSEWSAGALRALIESAREAPAPMDIVRRLAQETFSVDRMLRAISVVYDDAAR